MSIDTAYSTTPAAAALQRTAAAPEERRTVHAPRPRIAYIMSRFPKLTETFVLFEMLAVERHGARVEVFPLLRARNSATHPEGAGVWKKFVELFRRPEATAVMHPEAAPFVQRAHFAPVLGWSIVAANLYFAVRSPIRYFTTLGTLIRANLGSMNFLLGGLVLFPKMVYFAREMARLDITHIHAHFANHPAAAAYVIHQLTDIPYSFTAHGADLQVDQHMLCEKVAAAKYVIAISQDNLRLIEQVCGPSAAARVRIVRCGVDTSVFRHAEDHDAGETHAGRRSNELRIVCVGTLYEVKGHRYLIDACRLLRVRQVPFDCQLVGDGPMRDELQRQVERAELGSQVKFLGKRTRQEIADLLQRSDVLAAPSVLTPEGRREGIPVVLMEAMASGLPVVASNLSGIPELVEHERTGLLVAPRDATALADALTRLSADEKLRRHLGSEARRKVMEEFNLDRNAGRLLEYFTEYTP